MKRNDPIYVQRWLSPHAWADVMDGLDDAARAAWEACDDPYQMLHYASNRGLSTYRPIMRAFVRHASLARIGECGVGTWSESVDALRPADHEPAAARKLATATRTAMDAIVKKAEGKTYDFRAYDAARYANDLAVASDPDSTHEQVWSATWGNLIGVPGAADVARRARAEAPWEPLREAMVPGVAAFRSYVDDAPRARRGEGWTGEASGWNNVVVRGVVDERPFIVYSDRRHSGYGSINIASAHDGDPEAVEYTPSGYVGGWGRVASLPGSSDRPHNALSVSLMWDAAIAGIALWRGRTSENRIEDDAGADDAPAVSNRRPRGAASTTKVK